MFGTLGFWEILIILVIVIVVFAIRSALGLVAPITVLYGVIAELLLLWALRPNIKKLLAGKERVVRFSLNGWLRARKETRSESNK